MCEAIVHKMKIASEARPITREIGTQTEVTFRHCFDDVVWMPIIHGADAVIERQLTTSRRTSCLIWRLGARPIPGAQWTKSRMTPRFEPQSVPRAKLMRSTTC